MSIVQGMYFQRRTGGTGSILSTLQLGILPGVGIETMAMPEYRKTQEDGLEKWTVDAIVIPLTPNNGDIVAMRSAINSYITDFYAQNDWKPVEKTKLHNGSVYIRTRGEQRGDLITVTATGVQATIDTDVVLESVEVKQEDTMPLGAMVVQFTYIKEATNQKPDQVWYSFRLRAGGTGAEQSQINMTDSGVQSSRLTQINRDSNGLLESIIITAAYTSEFGTRTQTAIQDFINTQKESMSWHPVNINVTPNGYGKILNTTDNFGDITVDSSHGGAASETLMANCTLSDVRIVSDDGAGGVDIEYTFVRVRPAFQAPTKYMRFRIKTGGTGGHRSTIPFGVDDPDSAWLWKVHYQGEGLLTTISCQFWMPNDHGATSLLIVQAKGEGIRNACLFKPPLIKPLPRGKAIMPNLHQNFGDVVIHDSYINTSDASGDVLLANCTLLEPPRVENANNEGGCMITCKFGRIADSNEIT